MKITLSTGSPGEDPEFGKQNVVRDGSDRRGTGRRGARLDSGRNAGGRRRGLG